MLKAGVAVLVMALGGLFGLGRVERAAVYPFDATRVAPEALGLDLREVVFESGGERLILWVAEAAPGKPVILYFHGNAGNLAARAGRFAQFRARGYGVVALGYRGSSGSSGTPSERNIAFDAGRVFTRIGAYGAGPVVIYGESLGTAVALAAVERARRQPAAVVLEAPFTSVKAVARQAYPELDAWIDKMESEWDSLARVKKLRAPVMVIHGRADAVIPFEMGRAVYEAAGSSEKRFRAVAGGGHTDPWRRDVLGDLWGFIDAFGS
ncbi:alpha/beta hydrolase [Rhodalgimonas zhirmunskyi]|uniref:Alpha/beta hydrolase n=1 Tax=Rhodalgimonas zhirmunskyi TaxID=2964767 RepID=A0AAJ1UAX3_9RHOB|nr:alpha/beta hydrolase [Rhodoalgimonas zhirmunskyi]MDQ2092897.1 alpha/beta hydrolase [Rhodoalgimonas zhirmunskyi]